MLEPGGGRGASCTPAAMAGTLPERALFSAIVFCRLGTGATDAGRLLTPLSPDAARSGTDGARRSMPSAAAASFASGDIGDNVVGAAASAVALFAAGCVATGGGGPQGCIFGAVGAEGAAGAAAGCCLMGMASRCRRITARSTSQALHSQPVAPCHHTDDWRVLHWKHSYEDNERRCR